VPHVELDTTGQIVASKVAMLPDIGIEAARTRLDIRLSGEL